MDLNVILFNENSNEVHCIILKWKTIAQKGKVMWMLLHFSS